MSPNRIPPVSALAAIPETAQFVPFQHHPPYPPYPPYGMGAPYLSQSGNDPGFISPTSMTAYIAGFMPHTFYTCGIPDDSPAIFSTQLGALPKRKLVEPFPAPIVRSDTKIDIEMKAKALMAEFPEQARHIKPPQNWSDLYFYFDGVDIWIQGAAFCFWVLHGIVRRVQEIKNEAHVMIDELAKEWIGCNEPMLPRLPETQDLISQFDDLDKENLKGMREEEIVQLRLALEYYRSQTLDRLIIDGKRFRQLVQPFQQSIVDAVSARGQPLPVAIHHPHPANPQFAPFFEPINPFKVAVHQQSIQPSHSGRSELLPHQTYNHFLENQRNIAAVFNPPTTPNDIDHDENLNYGLKSRPRGLSNETNLNGRGTRGNGRFNNLGNQCRNGRQWGMNTVTTTPRKSPLRGACSGEPVYVLTSQKSSPNRSNHRVHSQETPSDMANGGNLFSPSNPRTFSERSGGDDMVSKKHNDLSISPICHQRAKANPSPTVCSTPVARGPSNLDKDPCASYQSSSTGFGRLSNDARVLDSIEKQETRVLSMNNSSSLNHSHSGKSSNCGLEIPATTYGTQGQVTHHYSNVTKYGNRQEQATRTVFVGGAEEALISSGSLKDLFSECGELDTISYLPKFDGSWQVFVVFLEKSSVQRAIQNLNGYRQPAGSLVVSIPRKSVRERSGNHVSQRSNSYSRPAYNSKTFEQHHPFPHRASPRRQSLSSRQSCNLGAADTAEAQGISGYKITTGLENQLMSSMSEIVSHQAALSLIIPTPQAQIDNIRNLKRSAYQEMKTQELEKKSREDTVLPAGPVNRKENSPMENNAPPNSSPSRESSFVSQPGNQVSKLNKSKKKGHKQNTLTQSTPAVSPAKSCSKIAMSNDFIGIKTVTYVDRAQNEKNTTEQAEPQPLIKKPLSLSTNSTVQLELLQEGSGLPSKKKSIHKPNSQSRKKKKALKSEPDSANTSFNTEASSGTNEPTSPIDTESTGYMASKSTNSSFCTISSRKPSVASVVSAENSNTNEAELFTKSTDDVFEDKTYCEWKSRNNLDIDGDETGSLSVSASRKELGGLMKSHLSSEKSTRKADVQLERINDSDQAELTKTAVESVSTTGDKLLQSLRPSINVEDQREWPALGLVRSLSSGMASSKHPANCKGSTNEQVAFNIQKQSKSFVVPVIPRSYNGRTQSAENHHFDDDELGSITWPFVKRVRGK